MYQLLLLFKCYNTKKIRKTVIGIMSTHNFIILMYNKKQHQDYFIINFVLHL